MYGGSARATEAADWELGGGGFGRERWGWGGSKCVCERERRGNFGKRGGGGATASAVSRRAPRTSESACASQRALPLSAKLAFALGRSSPRRTHFLVNFSFRGSCSCCYLPFELGKSELARPQGEKRRARRSVFFLLILCGPTDDDGGAFAESASPRRFPPSMVPFPLRLLLTGIPTRIHETNHASWEVEKGARRREAGRKPVCAKWKGKERRRQLRPTIDNGGPPRLP